jgi:hypothetical protein
MTNFFLDLWQDLRAKRLWPIAVALLAATLAVPALLLKPTSAPRAPNGASQVASASKLPTVALDASSVESSHLNVFKEKNPFSALSDPDVTKTTTSGGGSTSPTGGTGSTGTSTGSSIAGAGTTSSTGTSSGGTSGSKTPTGPDGKPVKPGVHYFTYTADVRFGARGHLQDYKGIHYLDVLPNGNNPVVALMGVKNGDTAVFFIADPAFRADGEGDCLPDPDNCMFLYLKQDADKNEETLSAQNGQVEYVLELTGLHVETVDESKVKGDTTPSDSGSGTPAAKRRKKELGTLVALPALLARR